MRTTPISPAEAAENTESVRRVPRSVLPVGPARDALVRLATSGRDCSCYASGGEILGIWCVWLGDLAEARRYTGRDGRVPLSEWATRWRELVTEMGSASRDHTDDGLEVSL